MLGLTANIYNSNLQIVLVYVWPINLADLAKICSKVSLKRTQSCKGLDSDNFIISLSFAKKQQERYI